MKKYQKGIYSSYSLCLIADLMFHKITRKQAKSLTDACWLTFLCGWMLVHPFKRLYILCLKSDPR